MDHQVVALMQHLEEARERERKSKLPPGFRFHPTDEELIAHYLLNKVLDSTFSSPAIAHVDLNKSEPWELPGRAKMGEKEWYFFSVRDRKYPTGLRTNRATEGGYWKATGKDREILSSKTTSLIGMKKTLVFYKGRAPKGDKTNWVMHEFRLAGKFAYHFLSRTSKDEWVISRVFNKSGSGNNGVAVCGGALKKFHTQLNGSGITQYPEPNSPSSASTSLPPLLDSSPFSNAAAVYPGSFSEHVTCFSTTNSFNFAPPHFSAFPNLRSLPQPLFSPVARDWQAAEESRSMVLADVASTMWTF